MDIQIEANNPENWQADAAIAFCCADENPAVLYPELDKASPWLAIAPALRDFRGKSGELAFFYGHPDLALPRVLAVGLGERAKLDLQAMREGAARAARKCRGAGLRRILLPAACLKDLPGGLERAAEEFAYAFELGLYRFTELKTKKKDEKPDPEILVIEDASCSPALGESVARGQAAARAVSLARDLDNLPGNMLYPETLALRAANLASTRGLRCSVHNRDNLREMGAGCLLAVGAGSSRAPRIITLEYAPKNHEDEAPLVFIGKGITFDSGGLCIKPAANMGQMKCDMSGAAAALAAICVAAEESVPRRIVAVLACAENMPDGGAYRPGDVLTAFNGESVEVVNTDAEGRLALADALSFAIARFKPCAVVDIATLTGACAIALGNDLGGLFCDDDDCAERILAFGAMAGENFWRMPLWAKYGESLKSEIADIRHTGSREGGAITAALFLKNFAAGAPVWAHMDIAGVDWNGKDSPLCPEGPTGFGARTLLEIARGGLS